MDLSNLVSFLFYNLLLCAHWCLEQYRNCYYYFSSVRNEKASRKKEPIPEKVFAKKIERSIQRHATESNLKWVFGVKEGQLKWIDCCKEILEGTSKR